MRRISVDALPEAGVAIALSSEASHHLLVVCRHPRGGPVVLFDGTGHESAALLDRVEDGTAWVVATEAPRRAAPTRAVHLVLGLPKGPAADDAVRMATEAGATSIHPVWADRTQGRPARAERWRRIAESAAAQCGRADVPEVYEPASLADVVERLRGVRLRVAHPGLPGPESGAGPVAVCIGPEGGWTTPELEHLWNAGATSMDLGRWILRTATAAAVAVSRLAE